VNQPNFSSHLGELQGHVENLEVRLQGKLQGRVRDLQLRLQESGLVLRGHARTYYAKQLAQHTLLTETNLAILANEIEVY